MGDLVEPWGMISLLKMREFVHEHGVDNPLRALTQSTRNTDVA